MSWLTASLRIVLTATLLIQSVICMARKDRNTKVGIMAFLLAAVSLFFGIELPTGDVVVSTDFAILMVQGDWSAYLIGLAVVVISLCAGLFCLNTREAANPSTCHHG